MMLMYAGTQFGVLRNLRHFWGVCFGFSLMAFLNALGLSFLFTHYPVIKLCLSYFGSCYLFYMAWVIFKSSSLASSESTHAKSPMSFMAAFFFQWMNPKAWIMLITTLSLFHVSDDVWLNAVWFSCAVFTLNVLCLGAWLGIGASAKSWVSRYHFHFSRVMATLLAASVIFFWL